MQLVATRSRSPESARPFGTANVGLMSQNAKSLVDGQR